MGKQATFQFGSMTAVIGCGTVGVLMAINMFSSGSRSDLIQPTVETLFSSDLFADKVRYYGWPYTAAYSYQYDGVGNPPRLLEWIPISLVVDILVGLTITFAIAIAFEMLMRRARSRTMAAPLH